MLSERSQHDSSAPPMQFGSVFGGLFCNDGADPRDYFGPPNPRRAATPKVSGGSSNQSSSERHRLHNLSSVGRSRSTSPSRANVKRCMAVAKINANGTIVTQSSAPASEDGRDVGDKSSSRGGSRMESGSDLGSTTATPGHLLTLEMINLDGPCPREHDMVLNSPRSVEACLRLGLSPLDFFAPSFDTMVRDMKDNGEDVSDESVVKLRFSYLVQRAKQKYVAACEERVKIMVEEAHHQRRGTGRHGGSSSAGDEDESSTRIKEEEKRLQKIVENNKSRLRQQLLHTQLVEKQREREEQRMEAQRRADEQQKRNRLREMLERNRKEEEAQALRHEARELERQEQQRRVELKRALYDAKDREVKGRIARQRMEAEAENEAKRLLNLERQKQMKEQAETVALERRAEFQRRNEAFEAAQLEYKHQLEVRREERKAVARLKQRKIREAIERSNEQLSAKIHRALEKERLADELRQQQAVEAAEQQRLKHQRDAEKEMERQAVIREAQHRQELRVQELEKKIQNTEHHMAMTALERDAEARIRAEVQRQKELDKQDCVLRSKFMDEYRIAQLEQSNVDKAMRVAKLQTQQAELKEKRKLHRQEAERTRVVIQEVTPGPSDFVVTQGSIGTEGPRWKMGLPASALAMRQVMKNAPAPGYVTSPGPCVYQYEQIRDARHREPEAFSMMRHDRWKAQSEASRTPGPSDYAPSSPPFVRSRPNSSAL